MIRQLTRRLFDASLLDLKLAVRSIVFAAAGTCGQRCTSLRRLIAHESIADELRTVGLPTTPDLATWGEGLTATFQAGRPLS